MDFDELYNMFINTGTFVITFKLYLLEVESSRGVSRGPYRLKKHKRKTKSFNIGMNKFEAKQDCSKADRAYYEAEQKLARANKCVKIVEASIKQQETFNQMFYSLQPLNRVGDKIISIQEANDRMIDSIRPAMQPLISIQEGFDSLRDKISPTMKALNSMRLPDYLEDNKT